MKSPLLIVAVKLAFCLSAVGCLDLLGRRASDHSTAGSGGAAHTETRNDTRIDAGGDATVNNWTFNATSMGTIGGCFVVVAVGWVRASIHRRREQRAVDLLADSIEETQCRDCKRAVQARGDAYVAERVKRRYHRERK